MNFTSVVCCFTNICCFTNNKFNLTKNSKLVKLNAAIRVSQIRDQSLSALIKATTGDTSSAVNVQQWFLIMFLILCHPGYNLELISVWRSSFIFFPLSCFKSLISEYRPILGALYSIFYVKIAYTDVSINCGKWMLRWWSWMILAWCSKHLNTASCTLSSTTIFHINIRTIFYSA